MDFKVLKHWMELSTEISRALTVGICPLLLQKGNIPTVTATVLPSQSNKQI